jgi:general secretion pathway protein E
MNAITAIRPEATEAAFGRALVARAALPEAALERALRLQGESGERLVVLLSKLGLLSEEAVAESLSAHLGLPLVTDSDLPRTPVRSTLSPKFLKQAMALPILESPDRLVLAVTDPLDREALDAVRYAAERPVEIRIATPSIISKGLAQLQGGSQSAALTRRVDDNAGAVRATDAERLRDLSSDAPVIKLVNLWIDGAVEARASDIHIEATEHTVRVRYRIDGSLQDVEELPPHLGAPASSRIKVMAKLNIAERRLPQDGKFRTAVRGKEIDFRVSIVPSVHGESIVLRILDRNQVALDFAALGFEGDALQRYLSVLQRPHGILLVTGPTGSGKTTTLYTSLLQVRNPGIKILTVEDPVEYQLEGINQTQVQPQIGLTFASALRSFLRHDPDVILVGEIRDTETARIAVQAALTGHLVLSTLHTNDAVGAVTRLLDMGVEDYLIASTVNGIAAQRLVKRLCQHCRVPHVLAPELARGYGFDPGEPVTVYRPGGCPVCGGTGFAGRSAITEVLTLTEELRQLVMRHAESGALLRQAEADGMETMYRNGLRKCRDGITTIDEVLRVTSMA